MIGKTKGNIYDIIVKEMAGTDISLDRYNGKVLLIVNTASHCGFTPQFEGLEALYQRFKDEDFEILGFPCNQFAGQDPGSNQDIQQFCQLNYGVSFKMFQKIEVKGAGIHPLYHFLTKQRRGFLGSSAIKWNFTKFLVDREGRIRKRFAPMTKPAKIARHIQKLI